VLNKIIDLAESLQDERYDYAIDPIINKEKFRQVFGLTKSYMSEQQIKS
jgi:hypothetical protein